ncbi:MAG: segregation/condensation protein A [Clostridiales bacterium]|nr:segregation/condensation protein A [Clostridiales bacterium]MDY3745515.1 segregation/condensation protein A [Lachnospiraceae bacterium]
MAIPVKLQVFEGPLDLLLHLIEVNKIDIYDIPISLVTDQYLDYIQSLQDQDMEVMSEFLVMAATLLRIKSKMLLPPEKEETDEEDEGDPRAELVERLLEYKMYKYAANELKDRQLDASKSLFKGMTLPEDLVYEEPPVDLDALVGDMDIKKLHQIFKMVMKRQNDKLDPIRSKYGKIVQEEINLADKMSEIEQLGRRLGQLSFREILYRQPTKLNAVMTFLAILELTKSGKIKVHQQELFDDIEIDYVGQA